MSPDDRSAPFPELDAILDVVRSGRYWRGNDSSNQGFDDMSGSAVDEPRHGPLDYGPQGWLPVDASETDRSTSSIRSATSAAADEAASEKANWPQVSSSPGSVENA